jgi:hypothetical protein
MAAVIDIFNEDGTSSLYRKLSARIPGFVERYGPEKGYAVVIEATDTLSLQPGLLRLYEQAVACGHNLEKVGLPPLARDRSMVFKARLEDNQGRILATAAAVKPGLQYKDFEAGETAARQRLLAALGFGGEVLDADEAVDLTAQQLITEQHSAATAPAGVQSIGPATVPDSLEAESASGPLPDTEAEETTPADQSIPPALKRQIEHLAKMKNRELPRYCSLQEARDVLKQLMAA